MGISAILKSIFGSFLYLKICAPMPAVNVESLPSYIDVVCSLVGNYRKKDRSFCALPTKVNTKVLASESQRCQRGRIQRLQRETATASPIPKTTKSESKEFALLNLKYFWDMHHPCKRLKWVAALFPYTSTTSWRQKPDKITHRACTFVVKCAETTANPGTTVDTPCAQSRTTIWIFGAVDA